MKVVCIGKKLFIHETDGMSGHSGVDLITLMIESVSGNVGLTVEPTGKYYEIPYTDFFDKDNLPLGVDLVDVVTKLKDARDTALEGCTQNYASLMEYLLLHLNAGDGIEVLLSGGNLEIRNTSTGASVLPSAYAYSDSLVVGTYRSAGSWDASTGVFPVSGTGTAGAVRRGDVYNVTVAGTIGGINYDVGDTFYAVVNTPAQVIENWAKFEANTSQANESMRGTVKIAVQADVESSSTVNDTDAVTPKKLWQGLTRFLLTAWTWAGKQTFTSAPRFSSVTAGQVLEVDANKDLISSAKATAFNKNFGAVAGTVAEGNDSRFGLSNSTRVYSAITLANNTARLPSNDNDVLVVISFNQSADVGKSAVVLIQVDNSGGLVYSNVARSSNTPTLGTTGTISKINTITFLVPRRSNYRFVTSGTGTTTVDTHVEISM